MLGNKQQCEQQSLQQDIVNQLQVYLMQRVAQLVVYIMTLERIFTAERELADMISFHIIILYYALILI